MREAESRHREKRLRRQWRIAAGQSNAQHSAPPPRPGSGAYPGEYTLNCLATDDERWTANLTQNVSYLVREPSTTVPIIGGIAYLQLCRRRSMPAIAAK
jgi:hypothetical protein